MEEVGILCLTGSPERWLDLRSVVVISPFRLWDINGVESDQHWRNGLTDFVHLQVGEVALRGCQDCVIGASVADANPLELASEFVAAANAAARNFHGECLPMGLDRNANGASRIRIEFIVEIPQKAGADGIG